MTRMVASVLYLFILLTAIPPSWAGLFFNGTRVIYHAGKKEATLGLTNDARDPRLIQSWIEHDDGQTKDIPFIIMPPVFRLDAGKGQTLRIHFIGGDVPPDRESVYWINVLEVSPTPHAKGEEKPNYMHFPVRSRMKLFYRPNGLPGKPEEAASLLTWRMLPGTKEAQLECTNPTAFTVSLNNIQLRPLTRPGEIQQRGMCPARGRAIFTLPGKTDLTSGKVFFSVIDDDGGFHAHEASYQG